MSICLTRQIVVAGVAATATLEGIVQIAKYPGSWPGDFRFWATMLQIAALGIAFTVHRLEHERLRVPSAPLLFYWLFYIVSSIAKTRSLYVRNFSKHQELFALVATNLVLAIIIFGLLLIVPKKQSMYRTIGNEMECPSEYSNIFSILTFAWLTPMIKYGYKTFITEEDLWDLPPRATTSSNGDIFSSKWSAQMKRGKPSIWLTLLAAYGKRYLSFIPVKMTADSLNYVQPQLLRMLITFVNSYQTGNPEPALRGFLIAGAMFCVSVTQSMTNNFFMNSVFELGQVVRASLIATIYKKALRLSNEGRAAKSTGDIVNLMAVDTQRISELSRQGFQLWSAPFQITLCIVSLYNLLGWPGMAGLIIMAVMVPINAFIARLMKRFQRIQMKNKDERTRITTEILNNMKSIKLYSWTEAFASRLATVRNEKELKTLRKIGATQAANRFFWNSTPFFVSCATFTLYVLGSKSPLTVDLVFPALTLFNLLTQPLNQIPNVISSLIESMVAGKRLKEFFTAGEIQADAVTILPAATETGEEAVRVRQASFTWGSHGSKEVLSDINFSAHKGQLNCIVGRVGSGKTSLLQAILGDIHKLYGEVMVKGKVAYVSQNAWIMNASVKDNIIFGHRYDPAFYDKTIKASALIEDLAVLPDGDKTEVGEKGISLSGGQKARVQLARAVYARADIYILDDILSAVDQHVGRHIINAVVGKKGLLRGKTRILATNSIPVLKGADHISMISEGVIVEEGSYWDAIAKDGEIASLIKTVKSTSTQASTPTSSSSPTKSSSGMDSGDESEEDLLAAFDEKEMLIEKEGRNSMASLRRASTSSFRKHKKGDEEIGLVPISRQTKEVSQKGKVKWSVYIAYARACNFYGVVFWFLALIAVQSLQVSASVWLKNWSELNERSGGNLSISRNLGIYFALGVSSSAMIVLQTIIMWVYCAIQASKKLHERMARAMFRSPMSFFETTPTGRILNRFSTDMWRVDELIVRSFSEFCTNVVKGICTILVICATIPVFIPALIPLGALYIFIQKYYLRTNRELKRLESVSRSPIYAHFQESLGGLSTIRAFKQQDRWAWENENRVDTNMKAWLPSIWASRWLGVRLEFVGSLIVFSTATLSILAIMNGAGPSAGMLGLSMSYALNITQALSWMVRLSVEVETNIVSVERVLEYAKLPSEAPEVIPGNRPAPTWPARGAINFNDYSMRYRQGLDLVLKNISLSIKSQEKIGVVGRTGAGKSSLTLSLFRVVEAASGGIDVDNVDTSSIGLADLRSKLAIIPQDAALFEGKIRDNLDPTYTKTDEELWEALGTSPFPVYPRLH